MTLNHRHKYFSKIGIGLVLVYVLITAICLVMLYSTDDFKGQYIFLQLPIALQMGVVHTLDLNQYLRSINWFGTYIILWLPTIFFLYCMGWTLSQIIKSLSIWKV